MARVNVEESWWTSPKRSMLIRLVGGEAIADGVAMKLWRTAQSYWADKKSLIPGDVFKYLEHSHAIIEAGLVDAREGCYYACGTEKSFQWYLDGLEKIEALKAKTSRAGKASAEARKQKSGSAQPRGGKGSQNLEDPNKNRTESEQEPNKNGTTTEHIRTSSSSSSSSSINNNNNAEIFNEEIVLENVIEINSRSISDSARYEASFKAREITQINQLLTDLFEPHSIPDSFYHVAPAILVRFGTPEKFLEWLERFLAVDKVRKMRSDHSSFSAYFYSSLVKKQLKGQL